jgi:hypothetical protein
MFDEVHCYRRINIQLRANDSIYWRWMLDFLFMRSIGIEWSHQSSIYSCLVLLILNHICILCTGAAEVQCKLQMHNRSEWWVDSALRVKGVVFFVCCKCKSVVLSWVCWCSYLSSKGISKFQRIMCISRVRWTGINVGWLM